MHRLRVPVHHALIVSHLLVVVHNNKQNYCNYENIHLFIIKLHVALNIKNGGAAVIHGSARRNRHFHCSVRSVSHFLL